MPQWTDETSRARCDAGCIPQTWTLKIDKDLHVTVTRSIHHAPDTWLLLCHELGFRHREIPTKDLDEAKAWALKQVRARLRRWSAAAEAAEAGATGADLVTREEQ